MNDLLRAPWSDQPVRGSIRVLAWFFVSCGLAMIGLAVYFTAIEGFPDDLPFQAYALFSAAIYMTVLFTSSAIHGKAPHGWVPWETGSKVNPTEDAD